MIHIKFDQDWPTGLGDILVWKCGWMYGWTTESCHTISSPCEPLAENNSDLWEYNHANHQRNYCSNSLNVSSQRENFVQLHNSFFNSLHSTPNLSTPAYSTPLHSTSTNHTPLYPTPLHSTLVPHHFIPLNSTPFHSTLLHSTQLHSSQCHSTPQNSTPFQSTSKALAHPLAQCQTIKFLLSYQIRLYITTRISKIYPPTAWAVSNPVR